MIPLRDTNPTRGVPIVNRVLLLANAPMWVYTVTLIGTPGALEAFYDRYAFDWRAFIDALTTAPAPDALVPLFTHMFMHGSWLHVLGNVLYLWIFGDNVEDRLGSGPYLAFYLLCGVAAAVGQGLIAPAPMVGASGAVAGVLGAYLVMFPGARVATLVFLAIFISVIHLPAIIVIGLWVLVQALSGLAELRLGGHQATANVAYFAHLAGFAAGIVLLVGLRRRRGALRRR